MKKKKRIFSVVYIAVFPVLLCADSGDDGFLVQ